MLDIYLMRHGESEGNLTPHIVCGRSAYLPLSRRGMLQSRALGERLKSEQVSFDAIYVSPLKRAKNTAFYAGKEAGFSLDEFIFDEQIVERSHGEWEGKNRQETMGQFEYHHTLKGPGGESEDDVAHRMYTWFSETFDPIAHQNLTVGVFSHAIAIKCLLRELMGFNPEHTVRMGLHNASISRVKYDGTHSSIYQINDHSHIIGI